jgi:hypothetical protein
MNGRLALNERERSEPLIRQTGRLALNERERSERLIRQTFVRSPRSLCSPAFCGVCDRGHGNRGQSGHFRRQIHSVASPSIQVAN